MISIYMCVRFTLQNILCGVNNCWPRVDEFERAHTFSYLEVRALRLTHATHNAQMFITYFQVVWMYFMCSLPCESVNCWLCATSGANSFSSSSIRGSPSFGMTGLTARQFLFRHCFEQIERVSVYNEIFLTDSKGTCYM